MTSGAGNGSIQYFGYDALSRVTAATWSQTPAGAQNESFTYDADSNRLTATKGGTTTTTVYTVFDAPLTVQTGSGAIQTTTYDVLGRMRRSYTGSTVSTDYTYDAAGKLLRISPSSGAANTVTFSLDALGRHSQRLVGSTATEQYTYLGVTDTATRVATVGGSATESPIDALGDRLAATVGGTTVNWLLPDLHGNTAASFAGAAYSAAYRYDPYGDNVAASTGAAAIPWRFQGRLLESAAGADELYDFDARSYDPALGAFTSLDSVAGSIQNPLTLNRYLYANANPTTLIDPDGHCALGDPFSWGGCATDAVSNGAHATVDGLVTVAGAPVYMADAAADYVAPGFNDVVVDNLPGPIKDGWNTVASGPAFLVGGARGALDGTKDTLHETIRGVEGLPGGIAGCVGDAGTCGGQSQNGLGQLGNSYSAFFNDPGKTISGAFNSARQFGGGVWDDIVSTWNSGDARGAGVKAGHAAVGIANIAATVVGVAGLARASVSAIRALRNVATAVERSPRPQIRLRDIDLGAGQTRGPNGELPRVAAADDAARPPIPDTDVPHTQLGQRGSYQQTREWAYGENGQLQPTRDIDWTDHGKPQNHPSPHQHPYTPNNPRLAPRGGVQRGDPDVLPTVDQWLIDLQRRSYGFTKH